MTDQTPADMTTPDQVVGEMPGLFIPEKAGNTSAVIQFDLTGDNAGKWYIKIADGQASSGKGEVEIPNLTLVADSADFVKIYTNQLDPTAAFMSGKLKIRGDMGLAMKLQSLLRD